MTVQAIKRRIGILGGMGPEATVLLMARVVSMTSANDDHDHVSMIVDNNTGIPSRIKALIENNGEDPGPALADMARRLEAYGAQALAMPCNTAHHYAPMIEQAVDIPFLNMVNLAVDHIARMQPAIKRIGILASPAVRLTGVFDEAFAAHRIAMLYPSEQGQMLEIIRAVKRNSRDEAARQFLADVAQELIGTGADCLLIACSELSIIADAVPDTIPRIDSVDMLAQAMIEFAGAELRNPDLRGA